MGGSIGGFLGCLDGAVGTDENEALAGLGFREVT